MTARYPEYRDSGVEWLGEVPAHWKMCALKRVSRIRYGIGEPPSYREEGTPLIRATNVSFGKILDTGLVFVDPQDIPEKRILWLDVGDIIVVRSGAYTGDSAIIREKDIPAIAGFDMVVSPVGCIPGFLQYALLSRYLKNDQIDLEKLRAAQPHLNAEELGSCVFLLPSPSEQRDIVSFLDRETSKIDALVDEQRRLIELLKEKRRAVISHAVTKGLDPSVPMKVSGVEWLGEVPAHWEIEKFGRVVEIAEGQVDPREEPYASMLLIAPNHIERGTGRLRKMQTAEEQGADSGKYCFEKGAVLYSKIRPKLAKVVIAPDAGLCSADMYPLVGRGKIEHGYLSSVLLSPGFTAWAVLESDRVAMPKINRDKLNGLRLPAPPVAEQREIVAFLDRATAKIDTLIAEAEAAIALFQERRSALISAAVTGKIDIRGLVPVASESSEAA